MQSWMSRRLVVAGLAVGLSALALPALAQSWPTKPITMIVPFPAGGNTDVLARVLSAALSETLGQQIVVDNRGGAGGNIGAVAVAKAAPDGYTLLFSTPGPVAQNRLMYSSMPFDPDKDFRPIVLIANSPLMLAGRPDLPAKTLPELIAHAKANPGKLTVGTPGQGTLGHVASELLQTKAGIKFTNVPYRGSAPIITDLLGSQIDLALDFMSSYIPLVQDKRALGFVTTAVKRSDVLPNVPTLSETGFPGFEATAWYALLAPTGTPQEVVDKVNAAVNAWLKTPKSAEALASMAMQPNGGTPDELKAYIASEVAKWGPVIKAANIQF